MENNDSDRVKLNRIVHGINHPAFSIENKSRGDLHTVLLSSRGPMPLTLSFQGSFNDCLGYLTGLRNVLMMIPSDG